MRPPGVHQSKTKIHEVKEAPWRAPSPSLPYERRLGQPGLILQLGGGWSSEVREVTKNPKNHPDRAPQIL